MDGEAEGEESLTNVKKELKKGKKAKSKLPGDEEKGDAKVIRKIY